MKDTILAYAAAGEFDDALSVLQTYENADITEWDIYSMFVMETVKNNNLTDLIKYHDFVLARFGNESELFNRAMYVIEKFVLNGTVKLLFARAVTENAGDSTSAYINLQKCRYYSLDHNKNDVKKAKEILPYFLESSTAFPHYYADIVLCAMRADMPFGTFFNNLQFSATADGTAANLISTTPAAGVIIMRYATAFDWDNYNPGLKHARLMSQLATDILVFAGEIKDEDEVKQMLTDDIVDTLFRFAVRLRHVYLSLVYKPEAYNAEETGALPGRDGFTWHAAQALACEKNGDAGGFAKHMREALVLCPELGGLVSLVSKRALAAVQPAEQSPSALSELEQATKQVRTAIRALILTGELQQAEALLENYAEANPTDGEIEDMRQALANRKSEAP
jgi:hypothetical protein